jgi:hypothetical protein
MKRYERIADNLNNAGWSWGCVSTLDSAGRTIWIADAHRALALQQKQIEALTADLQKVSAQLELRKPAPQTVLNSQ